MKTIKILLLIIVLLIIIIANKNNTTNKKETNEIDNSIQNAIKNEGVQIISHKKEIYTIEVIIKNNTNKELKQVVVKAECYDKDGNNLGIATGGQYNINTKDTYKITIYCDTDTERYNLKVEYE